MDSVGLLIFFAIAGCIRVREGPGCGGCGGVLVGGIGVVRDHAGWGWSAWCGEWVRRWHADVAGGAP